MSRKTEATYINDSGKLLILDTQLTKMKYGKFTENPPAELEIDSSGSLFKAENSSTLKGCGGDVWYFVKGESAKKYHIYFTDPYKGKNEASFNYSSDKKTKDLDPYLKYNDHKQPMILSIIFSKIDDD